jgi:hypothetical protein
MANKSLLSIIQAVCVELNLPQPNVVVSSTDQNVMKLYNFLVSVCDDLLYEFEWQHLQTRYTFTTVDGQANYPMPTNLQKFINGTFYNSNNQWTIPGSLTPIQWECRLNQNLQGPFDVFRVFGNEFILNPTPGVIPYTFVFEYLSTAVGRDSITLALKSEFTDDTDICLFDHRLLIYGTKLKWRSSLGQDTTDTFLEFNRCLEYAKSRDVPAITLNLMGGTGANLLSTANYPDGNFNI